MTKRCNKDDVSSFFLKNIYFKKIVTQINDSPRNKINRISNLVEKKNSYASETV